MTDSQFREYETEPEPMIKDYSGEYADNTATALVHWMISDRLLFFIFIAALCATVMLVFSLYHCLHYCYYQIRPVYCIPVIGKGNKKR